MRRIFGMAILTAAAIGIVGMAIQAQPGATPAPSSPEDADRAAILKSAQDFAEAFNKGDAKAVAAMWTEKGESRVVGGQTLFGREAIEKNFAELFKKQTGSKIEVLVQSVRFPAKDMAVEQGLIRETVGTRGIPSTTTYVAVHAREAGQWRIALSSEAGHGEQRLEDLEWLLGSWTTKVKTDDVTFTFAKDPKKTFITGTFTRKSEGKEPVSGSIRIAVDPETGRIRSWGFGDDGAHSQSLWTNDGKSWLLEMHGVLSDGTTTSEVVVLQRVAADAITWRVTDRILGDERLPDTKPMRLTKTK